MNYKEPCRVTDELNAYLRDQERLENLPLHTCDACGVAEPVEEMQWNNICKVCADNGRTLGDCIFIDENENCHKI
jgi:hypothetical protein